MFGLKTPFYAYVLGEHTSVENELYQTNVKSKRLSIESRICIDLLIHVNVVKD